MAETTSFAVAATQATKQILCEVIVEALYSAGLRIPKPVIRAAVMTVLNAVEVVDIGSVRKVLRRLPLPVAPVFADDIWDVFLERIEEDDEFCELECPESGNTITLEEGDGRYTCPDCEEELEVEDGVGYHPLLVSCPVAGTEVWAHYEEDTYDCPECGLDIVVADGRATHERAPTARRRAYK